MEADEFVERNKAWLLASIEELRAGKGCSFATVEEAHEAAKAELREHAKNALAATKVEGKGKR